MVFLYERLVSVIDFWKLYVAYLIDLCKTWGFHSGEDSSLGLLCRSTV